MSNLFSGVVIASTNSNCGKTTAAIGLIAALQTRGIAVQPAKTGPDFLDAGWLARAANRPCLNIDVWMAPEVEIISLLHNWLMPGNLLILEGAMGLYDGAANHTATTAHLAAILGLPVLLLLNAKGMGQSVAALASGFLAWGQVNLAKSPRICGIVCTHVGSKRHKILLAEALAPVCKKFCVPLLGCLPSANAPQIPARHLGLMQACELDFDFHTAAQWFAANVDIDALLAALPVARSRTVTWRQQAIQPHKSEQNPTVAIARDAAFTFCYADLPALLQSFGARIIWFSPLKDSTPPECDAVYLPGGYPELYIQQLSANVSMLNALRQLAANNVPIYGECGGYMYMLEAFMTEDGKLWPLAGLLPGKSLLGAQIAALGYRTANSCWPGCEVVYGHEFHYAKAQGEHCQPLWQVKNARGEAMGGNGQRRGNVSGSWIHLYPRGSQSFWRQWLKMAARGKA